MRTIGFGEVEEFLLSDHDSGDALFSKGMKQQEWFTLDIMTDNGYLRLVKSEKDELDQLYDLYQLLEERLDLYFRFRLDFTETY